MPSNYKLANALVNAEANAGAALFNSGFLRIYDGVQPVTADTATVGQQLLAELTFNSTAFGAAALGAIVANAITAESSALLTGTATWFRCVKADGTMLCDGSVGLAASDLIVDSVDIGAGANVSVSAFTHTVTK